MNKVLNNSPVRTSRNFKINNIEIKDFAFPNDFSKFNTLDLTGNSKITEATNIPSFKYSLGIEDEAFKNINSNILITLSEGKNKQELVYNFDKENMNLSSVLRINVEENTRANVILKFKSLADIKNFATCYLDIVLNENSKLTLSVINFLNSSSDFLCLIEASLKDKANIDIYTVNLGSKNSVSNYSVNLYGKESSSDLSTIYLGKGNQLLDFNYICDLNAEKTKADILAVGALMDEAIKHFKGTLDFKTGAKKAKGNEDEFCYMLSKEAKSMALPIMLCTEDDVEGNHSSATGKIDEKMLFYLMTRGFSRKEAIKVIIKAKFNKQIEKMDESLKEEIIERIDNILD